MSKQIIVIGGGISGLSTLHYLKQKFQDRPDIQILLIEKDPQVGGVIQSESQAGCLFETGPEGFLNSKPSTLQLIEELGLSNDLIGTPPETRFRYLCIQDTLYPIPMNPAEFFKFKPLGFFDKLRVAVEPLIPAQPDPQETVYQFGCRRFGKKFTQYFVDAMATGIYGGDIRQLNLKTAFPQIYMLEKNSGSVIRGFMRQITEKRKQSTTEGAKTGAVGQLYSLRQGMAQLTNTLASKYKENIFLQEEVYSLSKSEQSYVVETNKRKYFADKLFLCAPAYHAARLLRPLSEPLAVMLERIEYVPLTAIGLVYKRSSLERIPKGFGYLVPSGEGKSVLGAIFSSNIFNGRSDPEHFLFRLMLRGDRHFLKTGDRLQTAQEEMAKVFKITQLPVQVFIADWPAAIPQYTAAYEAMTGPIAKEFAGLKHVRIVANYWGGVGINDCIQNAKNAVADFII